MWERWYKNKAHWATAGSLKTGYHTALIHEGPQKKGQKFKGRYEFYHANEHSGLAVTIVKVVSASPSATEQKK